MLKVAESICRVRTTTLLSTKNELKSDPILEWVKNVKPASNDTIFIYYSGHGGMNKNKETFLYLQDGYFFRAKMVKSMESARDCRLKMLITDCCSDGPEQEAPPSARAGISKKALQDLFLEHQGFLHVTAATEGEYSWCSPRYGGWFTRAMVDAFDDASDTNMDGFVSWEEVFKLTVEDVQKKFKRTFPFFSADQKKDMSSRRIESQTPKFYSMAKRKGESVPEKSSDPGNSQGSTANPVGLNPGQKLWTTNNLRSSFTVSIETDKPAYNVGDNVSFRVKTTENCYIIVLNWNSQGEPMQLYPNKYESGNFAVRGKEYMLPSSEPRYDFRIAGQKGEERIKIIALTKRDDNTKLRSLIPLDDGCGSAFSRVSVMPRKTMTGEELEMKVIEVINALSPSDWSTASCTIQIR